MTELLSAETRGPLLDPLFKNGWTMVEGRDAITKTFISTTSCTHLAG